MKRDCMEAEDAIWEHARTGGDLPAQVTQHTAECPNCGRAAAEAAGIAALMRESDDVPASPDCRPAVMERISGKSRRPAWAYAFASMLLVAVVIAGLYFLQSPPKMAQNAPTITPRTRVQEHAPWMAAPEQRKPEAPKIAVEEREPARLPVPVRKKRVPASTQRPVVAREKALVAEQPLKPEPAPLSKEDRPVAAVAVTWEAPGFQSSNSYGYVRTNPETGETTTCLVERSDGSVNIFLESKPGGAEPPGKGA